jgi:Glycoside Hydrolase Family 113
MQSSSCSRVNPQLIMLASLLTTLALLTLLSLREHRQKKHISSMKRSERPSEPEKVIQPATPISPVQRITPHVPPQKKKNILLSAGASLAALIIILAVIAATTLLPGLHLKTSEAKLPPSSPVTRASVTRTTLEKGIVFPRWSPDGYGQADKDWQNSLQIIKQQTASKWIEMPILFSQATGQSTVVEHSQSTVDVAAFSAGVRAAHALGLHVFFAPLMSVRESDGWSGSIDLKTDQLQQAWFDSYWNTLQPYVQAAAKDDVEQMAIGTELQSLQQTVPAARWNQLIARIRAIFKNTLTYDMNWYSLTQSQSKSQPQPDWFKNPELAMIGVSSYIPLTDVPQRIDPQNMPALWQNKVKVHLDALSTEVGKPVLISEIGYRNTSDALYRTWEAHSNAEIDSQEQAGAFEAALANTFADPQIGGIFFWGWDGVDQFTIKNRPATQILLKWYNQPEARRRSREFLYA